MLDRVDKKWLEEMMDRRFAEQNQRIEQRFAEQDKRFEEQDKRFAVQDKRFEEQDKRFEEQDKRFEEQDKRFAVQDKRFAAHDRKLDRLEYMIDRNNRELREDLNRVLDRRTSELQKGMQQMILDSEERTKRYFDMIYENRILPMIEEHIAVLPGADQSYELLEQRVSKLEGDFIIY